MRRVFKRSMVVVSGLLLLVTGVVGVRSYLVYDYYDWFWITARGLVDTQHRLSLSVEAGRVVVSKTVESRTFPTDLPFLVLAAR